MREEHYNEHLGLVLIPDKETRERAIARAKRLFSHESDFRVDQDSLPHITLYHAAVRDLPHGVASRLRAQLESQLLGVAFELSDAVTFGEKFVFWMLRPSSPNYAQLAKCHREALGLSEYLDHEHKNEAKRKEALSLTPEQESCFDRYGHALVLDAYFPHITLGYSTDLSARLSESALDLEQHTMTVERVELVRIGFPGRVSEVVATR